MNQNRPYPVVPVTPKAETGIKNGHPWIYDTEILTMPEGCENGGLIDVTSKSGKYLGTGLLSQTSKIRIRLLSRNANDQFDAAFFRRRLQYALDYRKTVMGPDGYPCCRLIFGEADHLPGLTIDRFGSVLVAQILSLGMDQRRELILGQLINLLKENGEDITAVYERSDVPIRTLEGLEERTGFLYLADPDNPPQTARITENNILYDVDFINGQKTGFFLDQKYNRLAAASISRGKRVLDCFSHTGAFALNAAKGGAVQVLGVDVSSTAVEAAQRNAALNHLEDTVHFQEANVFDLLTSLVEKRDSHYDMVILDPPAFTKSRYALSGAVRGYKEINLKAMKLLPRGGYLATCSCSHFMTDKLFCDMLRSAAMDAGVSLRQIEARQQSPDHPILWNVPETNYLKFYLFQVV